MQPRIKLKKGDRVVLRGGAIGDIVEHDPQAFFPFTVRTLEPFPKVFVLREDGTRNGTKPSDWDAMTVISELKPPEAIPQETEQAVEPDRYAELGKELSRIADALEKTNMNLERFCRLMSQPNRVNRFEEQARLYRRNA